MAARQRQRAMSLPRSRAEGTMTRGAAARWRSTPAVISRAGRRCIALATVGQRQARALRVVLLAAAGCRCRRCGVSLIAVFVSRDTQIDRDVVEAMRTLCRETEATG